MKIYKARFKVIFILILLGLCSVAFKYVENNFEISKNLDIFVSLYKELNTSYVDEINPGEFMKNGIDAMLKSLDPYTNFIPESEIEDYRIATTGQYGGIGASILIHDDHIIVSEIYDGFSAQKAGLIAGDRILEINKQSVSGRSIDDIHKILNGQQGSDIKIIIERFGLENPVEKTIMREKIKIDNIPYYGMLPGGIGYIKLSSFTQNATMEVKRSFLKLKENNKIEGLVIDLKGNGGGLLLEAVNICNLFIQKGELIVSTKGKIKERNINYKTSGSPIDLNIPIAVLVDKNSASASEIVSGAIQDLDRGIIIGQRTYGKGLVQNIFPLSFNAQVKVTVAKYYIPSGRCIQAIDYSHIDEEGSFSEVPDSLINEFKTKNGRAVFDGGGIEPDFKLEPLKLSNISKTLLKKFFIFDFATKFFYENKNIASPKEFVLTDEIFDDFVKFINDKDCNYITKSEQSLEKFKEYAEKENYFIAIRNEYEALKSMMIHNKENDLKTFKNEIKQLLKEEIVSRYYNKKGKIEAQLSDDPEIMKAIEILSNESKYNAILDGSIKVFEGVE